MKIRPRLRHAVDLIEARILDLPRGSSYVRRATSGPDESGREHRLSEPQCSRENGAMAHGSITDEELAELLRRTAEAASAFMRGDMSRYLELTPHARGFTLMNPFGGVPTRYDNRAESLAKAAGYFKGGKATLELVQAHASGDLLVLVMIERQRGEVGGLSDQDWSLRVTQVYRREDAEWRLVHRQADPLVKKIGLEQAAAIARLTNHR
jgi:ketosteroid isomerase-like protein